MTFCNEMFGEQHLQQREQCQQQLREQLRQQHQQQLWEQYQQQLWEQYPLQCENNTNSSYENNWENNTHNSVRITPTTVVRPPTTALRTTRRATVARTMPIGLKRLWSSSQEFGNSRLYNILRSLDYCFVSKYSILYLQSMTHYIQYILNRNV